MFSLYIDRLEAFAEPGLLTHITATEKHAMVAHILLPSSLFPDDIVFVGTDIWCKGGIAYLGHIILLLRLKSSHDQYKENKMAFGGYKQSRVTV